MTPATANAIPDPGSELARLAGACFDGSITLADRDRLAELLRDPGARAAYRRMVWLHANLMRLWSREMDFAGLAPQPVAEDDAAAVAAAAGWERWHAWSAEWFFGRLKGRAAAIVGGVALALAVAAVVLVAGVGLLGSPRPPTLVRPPRAAGTIAAVAAVELPAWMPEAKRWSLWDGLLPGAVLELESGRIELAFDGGTQLVLEGPASFVVDGPKAVSLRRGKATVTVRGGGAADGRARFTVQTPSATVTDIGTSFGVVVDTAGETSVSVFDGLVDLLPRIDGALPLRLAAGESGAAAKRQPAKKAEPRERRFVRSLDRPRPDLQVALAAYGWNESRARPIYRDSFDGPGPLAGSKPSARGGIGDVAWVAPAEGWEVMGARGAVLATNHGAAVLPFEPQPGHLYLVSAVIETSDGGIGWGAVGFTNSDLPTAYVPHGPWMLQRHDADKQPNQCFAGPGETHSVGRGDRLSGEQTRTLLLDTTGPTWRAVFFAAGRAIGECQFDPAGAITHVGLFTFPNTRVVFHSFLVSSLSRLDR
jgi:hypothetical protein